MQIILAVLLGLAFGFIFEKYHFCMNSTITDVFLFGETRKLKGLLASLLFSALLFNLLIGLGITKAVPTPLWSTTIYAGVLFGIGMNLAGGCVSGTLFKMGQGYITSFIAFGGLILGLGTIGVMMTLMPLPHAGMKPMVRGTLPSALGIDPIIFAVAAVAASMLAYWAWARHKRRSQGRHVHREPGIPAESGRKWSSFLIGGILIAILNTVFFAFFSSPVGLAGLMAYAASGGAYLINGAWARQNPMFGYLLDHPQHAVIGLMFLIGACGSAIAAGRFRFRRPARRQAISSLLGGYLMGAGTSLMIGCNVTHVLGGLPQFGVGSIVATLGIVLGAWLGSRMLTKIVEINS